MKQRPLSTNTQNGELPQSDYSEAGKRSPAICPRVCVSYTPKTEAEIYQKLNAHDHKYWLELRLDALGRPEKRILDNLRNQVTPHTIITCRGADEGGFYTGTEEQRRMFLQHAVTIGFPYVDIELKTLEQQPIASNPSTRLVVSYHDFEKTPNNTELLAILDRMRAYRPAIAKLAVMTADTADARRLMQFLTSIHPQDDVIVIGMGSAGRITRILGPYLGSFLTFASSSAGASAPGQMLAEQLEEVYRTITRYINCP